MSEIEQEHPEEVVVPIDWHVPESIIGRYEAEEREWDAIVSKPHVRAALRRMAAEARQEYYAGETEEGGFAVE